MKKLLVVFMIVNCTNSLYSQDKTMSAKPVFFSIGAELSLPIGSFANLYNFGLGGSAQVNFGVANKTALTLNAGYIHYSYKSSYYYSSAFGHIIPLLGGVEYNFSPSVFGSAQIGISFFSLGSTSAFTYSPGIGFKLNRNFTALLKFTGWSKGGGTSTALGARLAYTFGKWLHLSDTIVTSIYQSMVAGNIWQITRADRKNQARNDQNLDNSQEYLPQKSTNNISFLKKKYHFQKKWRIDPLYTSVVFE